MSKIKFYILFVLGLFLTVLFLKNHPQSLIFPLWIFVYLFKDRLVSVFGNKSYKFVLVGLILSAFIEIFAIMQNIGQPESVRSVTLFHPDPIPDLILGLVYYSVLITTWYLILRKINFSTKAVFCLAGLFGVVCEQNGAVLLVLLAGGVVVALFVFFVYAVYPMLAHYITRESFSQDRITPKWWHYPLALAILYVSSVIISGSIFSVVKPLL
jgi:hypothetical protein